MTKNAFKLRGPIGKRLVVLIIGTSTLFALLSVAAQLAFNYYAAVQQTKANLSKYSEANKPAIEQAIWDVDYTMLDDLLLGFAQQQYVATVNLQTDDGISMKLGKAHVNQQFHVYPLVYQLQHLGQLSVGLDLSLVKQDIAEQLLVILLTNGLKTFLMSLIILLLVGRIVTRDLRRLADVADQIFTEQQQLVQLPSKLLQRKDEIGLVASSMQQLQQRLQRGLDARLEAEQQLHQHRQALEETIDTRTEVLNWQNEASQQLSELSLSFLSLKSTNADTLLQQTAAVIGRLFAVDRVDILEFDRQQAISKVSWSASGHARVTKPVNLSRLDELKHRLIDLSPTIVSDLSEIKYQAPKEYQLLRSRGVKSLATFALSDGNKAFGLLTCTSLNSCSIWPNYKITLLSQFAAAISGLIIKEMNDSAMAHLQNELLQVNGRLQVLAETDELTGLVNRRPFKRELNRAIASARRHESKIAVLMADIDYFKAYNDHYGHPQGDEALKQVAHALVSVVKRSEDCVARVGGEEFALLLCNVDTQELPLMAERIVKQVADLQLEHKGSLVGTVLTISLGGVLVDPKDVVESASLLELADNCLYQAKHQGRNRAVLDLDS